MRPTSLQSDVALFMLRSLWRRQLLLPPPSSYVSPAAPCGTIHPPISYIALDPSWRSAPSSSSDLLLSHAVLSNASAGDSSSPPITTTIIDTAIRLPAYPSPSLTASIRSSAAVLLGLYARFTVSCGFGRGISIAVPFPTSRAVTRILFSQRGHTREPHAAGTASSLWRPQLVPSASWRWSLVNNTPAGLAVQRKTKQAASSTTTRWPRARFAHLTTGHERCDRSLASC